MKNLPILVAFLCSGVLSSQNTFEKLYGTGSYEEIWESAILPDSTMLYAGYTGYGNAYFIKVNRYGDTLWTRQITDAGLDILYSVKITQDNGIIAAGRSNSYGSGLLDLYLVKLNSAGHVLWRKAIGGSDDESANEIALTPDKGFVIAGNTKSYGSGGLDFYIVKTDSLGNIQWTKTFGGAGNDNAHGIFVASNQDIVAAGLTVSGSVDVLMVRLDKNGNVRWQKQYGGSGDDRASAVIEASNKDLLVAGLYGGEDALVFRTDSSGNVLWSKSFGVSGTNEWAYSIKEAPGQSFVVCGYQNIGGNAADYLLFNISSTGNLNWARNFGGQGNQYATCVEVLKDKTYLITGYSQVGATQNYDYYIVKADETGKTPCSEKTSSITRGDLGLTAAVNSYASSSGGTAVSAPYISVPLGTVAVICQNTVTAPPPPPITTFLWEETNPMLVKVFPNPAIEKFTLTLPENATNCRIEIFDITGKQLCSYALQTNKVEIDTSEFPEGILLIKILIPGQGHLCKKVMVAR